MGGSSQIRRRTLKLKLLSETAMKAIAIRPPSRKIHFGRPTQLINTPYMRYDATPRPLTPEGNDGYSLL